MIYGTPVKGEDGMYHVKALTQENKKCFIKLSDVKVSDVDVSTGEVSFDICSEENQSKIDTINASILSSALENSKEWFGKELPEKIINNAFTKSEDISTDIIEATRIFDSEKQLVELSDTNTVFCSGKDCSVFVEFAGIWFAKKAFGPSWNLVQVKIHEEKSEETETEESPVESYPEEYMFEDEIEVEDSK
jgi:hypothetical protein